MSAIREPIIRTAAVLGLAMLVAGCDKPGPFNASRPSSMPEVQNPKTVEKISFYRRDVNEDGDLVRVTNGAVDRNVGWTGGYFIPELVAQFHSRVSEARVRALLAPEQEVIRLYQGRARDLTSFPAKPLGNSERLSVDYPENPSPRQAGDLYLRSIAMGNVPVEYSIAFEAGNDRQLRPYKTDMRDIPDVVEFAKGLMQYVPEKDRWIETKDGSGKRAEVLFSHNGSTQRVRVNNAGQLSADIRLH